MKKLFLLFLILPTPVFSQNLVLNHSFEDTLTCLGSPNQWAVEMAPPWFSPTTGSPDFFTCFNNNCWIYTIPSNTFGFQYARTGNCYIGLIVYYILPLLNNREYIEGRLSDTLKKNHVYCVEMYVSAANKWKYITDGIGILFTIDSIYNYTNHLVLPYTPQISNPSGYILNDTLNWMKVSGSFTAQGGERFISIGNFKDDQHTTLDTLSGALIPQGGYYYIDDVSVIDCTVGILELPDMEMSLSPNPAVGSLYLTFANYRASDSNISIRDVAGRLVLERSYSAGQKPREINIKNLPCGVYFLSFQSEYGRIEKRFVKMGDG